MSLFLFVISYLFAQPSWAEQNDIPFLVVKFYLEDKEINNTGFSLNTAPDWSWQEKAVKNVIRDIRENVGKYGLIIPTGGGKTRIANKIIIKWLLEQDGEVLWVTHRNILLSQAETSLVNLMDEMNISRSEQLQVRKKCHYASNLSYQEILRSENLSLIIIDYKNCGQVAFICLGMSKNGSKN